MQLHDILNKALEYAQANNDTKLIEAIEEKQENTIHIEWHIDDVLMDNPELSEENARDVLNDLDCNHDACNGINWDTINYVADTYKC